VIQEGTRSLVVDGQDLKLRVSSSFSLSARLTRQEIVVKLCVTAGERDENDIDFVRVPLEAARLFQSKGTETEPTVGGRCWYDWLVATLLVSS
jgi:hypothetical protein